MTRRYLAVDLPPEVDLTAMAQYLTERGVQWAHADPRDLDLYPDTSTRESR